MDDELPPTLDYRAPPPRLKPPLADGCLSVATLLAMTPVLGVAVVYALAAIINVASTGTLRGESMLAFSAAVGIGAISGRACLIAIAVLTGRSRR